MYIPEQRLQYLRGGIVQMCRRCSIWRLEIDERCTYFESSTKFQCAEHESCPWTGLYDEA